MADQQQIILIFDPPPLRGQRLAIEVGCAGRRDALDDDDSVDSCSREVFARRICETCRG
jgi:hypothetical protein